MILSYPKNLVATHKTSFATGNTRSCISDSLTTFFLPKQAPQHFLTIHHNRSIGSYLNILTDIKPKV